MNARTGATLSRTGEGRFAVNGRLDFQTVPGLLAESESRFGDGPITVDLAGVEHGNSAALALLLEWMRRRGDRLRLENLPPGLLAIARASDLEPFLSGAQAFRDSEKR